MWLAVGEEGKSRLSRAQGSSPLIPTLSGQAWGLLSWPPGEPHLAASMASILRMGLIRDSTISLGSAMEGLDTFLSS